MASRSKDVIFLLGAGASAEADIPVSASMIDLVEEHLRSRDTWKPHHALYNHVKSAIHFSAGLKGLYKDKIPFNIETLVNTLYELGMRGAQHLVAYRECAPVKRFRRFKALLQSQH